MNVCEITEQNFTLENNDNDEIIYRWLPLCDTESEDSTQFGFEDDFCESVFYNKLKDCIVIFDYDCMFDKNSSVLKFSNHKEFNFKVIRCLLFCMYYNVPIMCYFDGKEAHNKSCLEIKTVFNKLGLHNVLFSFKITRNELLQKLQNEFTSVNFVLHKTLTV